MKCDIYSGDNLEVLSKLADESAQLIYIDPPFNTRKKQVRTRITSSRDPDGDRNGFGDVRYKTRHKELSPAYEDSINDYWDFMAERLIRAHMLLAYNGSLFVHLDYREVHYVKIILDEIFGRECFINEIIWSYDYGGKPKNKWPAKHDTILWYAKDPNHYIFNYDEIDRIPYMAPDLVGEEKAARGKIPTDVWWFTIVPTNSKEKTGYPTQKPRKLLDRIIKVHSNPGDLVIDFFAGSGTTGEAALLLDRNVVLIDDNPSAIEIMEKRLAFAEPIIHGKELAPTTD